MPHNVAFDELAEQLEHRFAAGVESPWTGGEFDAFALRAFGLQYESEPAYRAYCDARGRTPTSVTDWRDVPPVPARAFKHLDLAVDDPEVVFLTSGTTRGPEVRGRHLVPRASLYRASLIPPFEKHVLVGSPGEGRIRFLSLIPRVAEMPHSSLSYMVDAACSELAGCTSWAVDGAGVLDENELRAVMAEAAETGEPVLVLGTALSLLHAVERLEDVAPPLLPPGSRVMETGGFKGLDREVSRDELHARVAAATGVPETCVVSEYGMTELLSQLYSPLLTEGPSAADVHVPPPWLAVRALDPVSLQEVEPGQPGLLAFFDLANAGSLCHVLTEDVGSVVDGRVRLSGRARGAEPRGCSRAMDELMSAAGTP